jgi:hypothetical protein
MLIAHLLDGVFKERLYIPFIVAVLFISRSIKSLQIVDAVDAVDTWMHYEMRVVNVGFIVGNEIFNDSWSTSSSVHVESLQ